MRERKPERAGMRKKPRKPASLSLGEEIIALKPLPPPTPTNTMSLAAYCMAYARWRTAKEALARVTANGRR